MDFYTAKEFFSNLYQNRPVTFELDDQCISQVEVVYTDGKPHPMHQVEYNKLKITVPGEGTRYIPIAPHREGITFVDAKGAVDKANMFFIPPGLKDRSNEDIGKMIGVPANRVPDVAVRGS